MERYRLVRKIFGGSDVYDSEGKQVAYSLPGILGGGEDFYDMDGNPLGQSYDSIFGGEAFSGMDGSYGFTDEEIMMGRNLYLHGELGRKSEGELRGEQDSESSDCDQTEYDNSSVSDFDSFSGEI